MLGADIEPRLYECLLGICATSDKAVAQVAVKCEEYKHQNYDNERFHFQISLRKRKSLRGVSLSEIIAQVITATIGVNTNALDMKFPQVNILK